MALSAVFAWGDLFGLVLLELKWPSFRTAEDDVKFWYVYKRKKRMVTIPFGT